MTKSNSTKLTVIVVSCVIFAVLLFTALIINLIKLASISSRLTSLNNELNALDKIITENNGEITYRGTDEYIDKYARDYLNMAGKDEITFIGK